MLVDSWWSTNYFSIIDNVEQFSCPFFLPAHQISLGNVFARCLGIMAGPFMTLTGRSHLHFVTKISISFSKVHALSKNKEHVVEQR